MVKFNSNVWITLNSKVIATELQKLFGSSYRLRTATAQHRILGVQFNNHSSSTTSSSLIDHLQKTKRSQLTGLINLLTGATILFLQTQPTATAGRNTKVASIKHLLHLAVQILLTVRNILLSPPQTHINGNHFIKCNTCNTIQHR